MTFEEVLKLQSDNPELEHQLRAAKIVNWMLTHGELEQSEAEELFAELEAAIYNSEEEFDEIARIIRDEIREDKKAKEDEKHD